MTSNLIIRLKETDSTNIFAGNLLNDNKETTEWTIIQSNSQINGKGQTSNSWESEAGKNLTFSVILHPSFILPADQFKLNIAVSLAIHDFASILCKKKNIKIKWPNDIYCDDNKIAGVLIENRIEKNRLLSSIVGIGININQTTFNSDAPNPTSIKNVTEKEKDYDLEQCLDIIIKKLKIRYKQIRNKETNKQESAYIKEMYRINSYHSYIINGKPETATITGICKYGKLALRSKNKILFECDNKEIVFVQ